MVALMAANQELRSEQILLSAIMNGANRAAFLPVAIFLISICSGADLLSLSLSRSERIKLP